jgi:hypothetical protein
MSAAVWIVIRSNNYKPGNSFACDDLETLCPRDTADAALAAYAARWPATDMSTRRAVEVVKTELPDWGRFSAEHCFRIPPTVTA